MTDLLHRQRVVCRYRVTILQPRLRPLVLSCSRPLSPLLRNHPAPPIRQPPSFPRTLLSLAHSHRPLLTLHSPRNPVKSHCGAGARSTNILCRAASTARGCWITQLPAPCIHHTAIPTPTSFRPLSCYSSVQVRRSGYDSKRCAFLEGRIFRDESEMRNVEQGRCRWGLHL